MEWGDRLIRLLEQTFQIEHLVSPEGKSYGAGHPVLATSLLQSVIPVEDLEFYPDLLIDEWAAQKMIDQELGLEMLVEFDLGGDSEHAGLVQFLLLEGEGGESRLFVGRKTDGRPLEFLAAVDPAARWSVLPALLLALLAADAAFGESVHEIRIPAEITNGRPDLFPRTLLERGFDLMFDHLAEQGLSSWEALAEFQDMAPDSSHTDILTSYFNSSYVESEPW